jgi:hypothetical protein
MDDELALIEESNDGRQREESKLLGMASADRWAWRNVLAGTIAGIAVMD